MSTGCLDTPLAKTFLGNLVFHSLGPLGIFLGNHLAKILLSSTPFRNALFLSSVHDCYHNLSNITFKFSDYHTSTATTATSRPRYD